MPDSILDILRDVGTPVPTESLLRLLEGEGFGPAADEPALPTHRDVEPDYFDGEFHDYWDQAL